ncbi:predicted protein [Plenodomus lingam JN3]|uniref:Predicted protein n=1 Tax=Leptosphaeria maculans (strain JN3 / isolate v23.1.3 / race Av1-4-5-6-7-8) TaxID=985895 RepID=E4ZQT6_LEPMJ|nr:predicted protein [Plenodomus lingam JN3]CBX94091.1 predicted protein [Plenodomus lingam JN3]
MVGQARHQAAHVFAKSPVRAGKGANSGMMRDLKDDAEPVAKSEVSIKHPAACSRANISFVIQLDILQQHLSTTGHALERLPRPGSDRQSQCVVISNDRSAWQNDVRQRASGCSWPWWSISDGV